MPAVVAAAVRAGTEFLIEDEDIENLNEFVANEIEKAGAILDHLCIKKSVILGRMMTIAE